MGKLGRHRHRGIDTRLLRDLTEAAREFRRSRGDNRMMAIQRYVAALHRFTERALQWIEPG